MEKLCGVSVAKSHKSYNTAGGLQSHTHTQKRATRNEINIEKRQQSVEVTSKTRKKTLEYISTLQILPQIHRFHVSDKGCKDF